MKKIDWNQFKNPSPEYRAKPFWALNGKLEKKHLKFQIKCMKEMGFGGAFLHSRTGLITEYMSKEWLDLMDYCVTQLNNQGMQAYLYDEDRWPSGICGGLVTENGKFRSKSMAYREILDINAYSKCENSLGFFAVELDENGKTLSYRQIQNGEELKKGGSERLFEFYYRTMNCDSYYNGYTYVDTMNKDATDCFIALTHEKYREKMGDRFGKDVIGIFADEPHRGPYLNGFGRKEEERYIEIPYTEKLFEEFYKRKGYHLEKQLPLLWFGDSEKEFCKASYDLIEVEQELFLENFAKPYHDWCKKYNLIVTGHVLHEDNLASQTTMCGSVMRYYEYMDYPGMDNLTEHNFTYNVPSLVCSVAKQLGKKFVLDELYGVTGWQMRFTDYKFTGDWQSACGVTLRCPHLSWYTMKGEAKRDYPASILHQSAWYKDFSVIEDYFSRMQYLLSLGSDCVDIAIINPIESTWGLSNQYTYIDFFGTKNKIYQRLEQEYYDLYKGLLLRGVYADYIDEGILQKYGKIKDNAFCCSKKAYKTILLNGNYNIRENTLKMLVDFLAIGGSVLVVGELPQYLNGERHDFSNELKTAIHLPFDIEKVFSLVKDNEIETGDSRIIVQKRDLGKEKLVLLLNSQKREEFTATIRIKTPLSCEKLNLRTGEKEGIAQKRSGNFLIIEKHFAGDEECMLLLTDNVVLPQKEKIYIQVKTPMQFDYTLQEPNILVLDNAEYFIDGEPQGSGYVLNIDKAVRQKYGLEIRHGEMIQPWFKKKFINSGDKKYCTVTLKYTFNIETIPQEISLMGEDLNKTIVRVNSILIDNKIKTTPIDNAFELISLSNNVLRQGNNILELTFDFYETSNIEGIFLCGNFGVKTEENSITSLPKTLTFGNFNNQGLSYYGGRITLSSNYPNGEYKIKTRDLGVALINVNDKPLAFSPYEQDFTVKDSKLQLELVFTRQNMFGCSDNKGKHTKLIKQGLLYPLEIFKEQ